MTNLVYAIGSPETHRVKIGRTTDLEARLRRLQTTSPVPLDVAFLAPGGKVLESALHSYFAPLRTHGEWFDFEGLDAADKIHKAVATFTSQEFADAARSYTAEVQQHLSTLRTAAKNRELQRQRLREAIAREMLTNPAATVTTMAKYVPWSEETLRGIAREFDVPLKRPPTVRSIRDKPES